MQETSNNILRQIGVDSKNISWNDLENMEILENTHVIDVFTSESFTTYGFYTESWQWHQVFDCKRFGGIPFENAAVFLLCSNKKDIVH